MIYTKHLDDLLNDLRSQTGAIGTDDARGTQLQNLADDIQRANGIPINALKPADIEERLAASILEFQGSHPRIAIVLNQLVEKLSSIGI